MNPHVTPLRYPGGKGRLTPFIMDVIRANDIEGGHYVEPYAGGAGVAIKLLLSGVVSHIHLNDSSPAIYAFWRSLQRDPDEFCRRISGASLTIEEWRRQREILAKPRGIPQMDLGFSLFFLNRCNRSGIPNAGPIGGYNQTGSWKIDARFPRNELIRRVEAIAARSSKISVTNLDAEVFIKTRITKTPMNTLVYCDPPYFHQANRLYLNHYDAKDHLRLARCIQAKLRRPWIVSYDNVPQVRACYSHRRSFFYSIQYNAARAYKGTEVFFVSDKLELPKKGSVVKLSLISVAR